MGFLDDYEPVEDRIRKFWEDHASGRIATTVISAEDGEYVVQAAVYRDVADEFPAASGLAQEHVTTSGVNKTSALENCETSAIGRALANLGYAAKGKRPSREEMVKVETSGSASSGGGFDFSCPHCGSRVFDNREENYGTKKPLWKCSNRECGGGKNGYSWASWDDNPFSDEQPIREDFEEPPFDPDDPGRPF